MNRRSTWQPVRRSRTQIAFAGLSFGTFLMLGLLRWAGALGNPQTFDGGALLLLLSLSLTLWLFTRKETH